MFIDSNETHLETIILPEGETYFSMVKGYMYTGRSIIIKNNIQVVAISILFGTFLGLVLSANKSKAIKYMVFFIIGNIFVNCIISIVYYTEFNYFKIGVFDIYVDVLVGFFMIYTVIFFLILSFKELINKIKVN
ncbi:hypothetical protein D3C72_1851350 [compost metagenome]